MDDGDVSAFFILLDVDPSDAYALFKLLDDDGSGTIDADEFVDGCLRLQGQAKSIDLAKVRHETKMMLQSLHKKAVHQEKCNAASMIGLHHRLDVLTDKVDR